MEFDTHMKQVRKYFTQDELIAKVRESFVESLRKSNVYDNSFSTISNVDCLMSGLAIFSFKFPSLLQFDKTRNEKGALFKNLKKLFLLEECPCDTYMRERLDVLDPKLCRQAFRSLFSLLQRGKILDNFRFFGDYHLISIDGTGVFFSDSVHCDNCNVIEHRDGSVTYNHQILAAALVNPDQKVVYPFAPEPIMKTDGSEKNDCERNAFKRWSVDFRREHPHLKSIILADALSSNEPFIRILRENRLNFILVCKEADHKYLTDYIRAADKEKTSLDTDIDSVKRHYEYILNVPLNATNQDCLVNVVRFSETKMVSKGRGKNKITKEKTTNWMWVTDLPVNLNNIEEFVKGGRARWKIENETINTLKNQGYNFEHNFGHGKKHLHTVFAHLMLLAFFIDQCLQQVNKRFQEALNKVGGKSALWEAIRACLKYIELPNFETLYDLIIRPPPPVIAKSVI